MKYLILTKNLEGELQLIHHPINEYVTNSPVAIFESFQEAQEVAEGISICVFFGYKIIKGF